MLAIVQLNDATPTLTLTTPLASPICNAVELYRPAVHIPLNDYGELLVAIAITAATAVMFFIIRRIARKMHMLEDRTAVLHHAVKDHRIMLEFTASRINLAAKSATNLNARVKKLEDQANAIMARFEALETGGVKDEATDSESDDDSESDHDSATE